MYTDTLRIKVTEVHITLAWVVDMDDMELTAAWMTDGSSTHESRTKNIKTKKKCSVSGSKIKIILITGHSQCL